MCCVDMKLSKKSSIVYGGEAGFSELRECLVAAFERCVLWLMIL